MKKIIVAMVVLNLWACVSVNRTPTPFAPVGQGVYVYKIKTVDNINMSFFEGNSDTRSFDALSYTVFAAYEFCKQKDLSTYLFGNPKEYSEKTTHTEVYSTQSYGVLGRPQTDVHSYPVTTTFPKFFVPFLCFKKMISLPAIGKIDEVSRELVHPVKKDFKGGLLVKEDVKDSPLKEGDVILSIGTQRVDTAIAFFNAKEKLQEGPVKVEIIRNGKMKTVKIPARDVTNETITASEDLLKTYCGYLTKDKPVSVCKLEWINQHNKDN